MPQAEKLVKEGRLDDSMAIVTAVFPDMKRTPAESFVLANLLYKFNPKVSYALHKKAADALPGETEPQYEWALEQHRAREYAGALAAYSKVSKSKPKLALVYGLSAECLLRLGKTKDAVAMWQKSESAPSGTLVDFETVVCEVNNHATPERDRADLFVKAKGGDIDAARKLIVLDCDFPRDWWNRGPNEAYLSNDLAILRKTKFTDQSSLKEILAAGDCALVTAKEGDVAQSLRKAGFLLDPAATLPHNGDVLSVMIGNALGADAVKRDDARAKWGRAILDSAKVAHDAEMFNVAANLYAGTDKAADIDQQAWDATGDVRFAESLFLSKEHEGKLRLDDPALTAAAKKFPEDAILAGIAVRLTAKAGRPMEGALINAIKAEYSKFSAGSHQVGLDLPRPGAELLQRYFRLLAKEVADK